MQHKWCVNIRSCNITILTGTSRVKCYKIGDMYLKTATGVSIILQDVRIVPTFRSNIVAERRFLNKAEEYFSLEESSLNVGLYMCRTKLGNLFVAVMGGPHLSALLMSRGDSKIRGTYLRFTELTRHVVNFLASKNVNTGLLFSALTTYVDRSLSERHRRHVIGTQKVFKALDLPLTVGTLWWPTKIRALRHLRLDSDGFVESLLRIIRLRGTEVAMAIFAIAPFRLADQVYLVWLDLWFERLGKDMFVTFICGSVACRFHDDAFTVWLDLWFERLGKDMAGLDLHCTKIAPILDI